MHDVVYLSSIAHAMELAGGPEALAERVNASASDVLAWARGDLMPSAMSLVMVLDVVMSETRRLSCEAMALGLAQMTIEKAASRAKAAE